MKTSTVKTHTGRGRGGECSDFDENSNENANEWQGCKNRPLFCRFFAAFFDIHMLLSGRNIGDNRIFSLGADYTVRKGLTVGAGYIRARNDAGEKVAEIGVNTLRRFRGAL